MELPCRSGLPAASRKKNFSESHIKNPLLAKLNRSKCLDIGLVLFLCVYGPRQAWSIKDVILLGSTTCNPEPGRSHLSRSDRNFQCRIWFTLRTPSHSNNNNLYEAIF